MGKVVLISASQNQNSLKIEKGSMKIGESKEADAAPGEKESNQVIGEGILN